MAASDNWNNIIDEAYGERFIGREQEIDLFRKHFHVKRPRYLIFYIFGQGGVGKTTLLNRYRTLAKEHGFLLTDADEQQRDVPSVLGRFARQLSTQGFPLKRFNERYKTYCRRVNEIEKDPEAPQSLVALLSRSVVRATFIASDVVPGLRKGLEYLPQESIETQASEWAAYLTKRIANKDELALMREPGLILTSLFFAEVNVIAQKQGILLCFENFEATRHELQEWFLHLREYQPLQNIRIVIAGRNQPGTGWDALRPVIMPIGLDVFTLQEGEALLDQHHVTHPKRRVAILEYSGRLPVLMSWLITSESSESETLLPTSDLVQRYLRWVNDPALRQWALLTAIPESFNIDILHVLKEKHMQETDAQITFEWLKTMPFVLQRTHGWQYHDVVRRMMLHYQRQRSPYAYQQVHSDLALFYERLLCSLGVSEEEQWMNQRWRNGKLTYAYHFLVADMHKHWGEVISLFAIAIRKHRNFAVELIERLSRDDVRDELPDDYSATIQLLRQQLHSIEQGGLRDAFAMFDQLCGLPHLSPQANGYLFAYRGECHRQQHRLEQALSDFNEALHYLPDDGWTLSYRGVTYYQLHCYKEALADLDRAVVLNKKDDWVLGERGLVYREMALYEKALADFNQAISLDEQEHQARSRWGATYYRRRGTTYSRLYRYEEALMDLDRAIDLNQKDHQALGMRGSTYRLLDRYEEALADLDRAISLGRKDQWTLSLRGATYSRLERYEEALVDFDAVITQGQNSIWYLWSLNQRGAMFFRQGQYQEALADFDRAIVLKENDDWPRYCRALIYMIAGQIPAFEDDLRNAIAIIQATAGNIHTPHHWEADFHLALYNLVGGNAVDSETRYNQLIPQCSIVPMLLAATRDLRDFLAIQPAHELAQHMYTQFQVRLTELKNQPTA